MLDFTLENLSAEEVERLREVYEPLAESVRELIDATVRTEVDADAVAAAKAEIDSATTRLRQKQTEGSFGVRYLATGERMAWGNAVIGIRNPIAPPVQIHRDADGKSVCDFHLGAAYEGPPGHVHGGVAALVLDHLLGEAASDGINPRLTGTISFRYVRADPARRPARRGRDHPHRGSEDLRRRPPRRRRGSHRRGRGRIHPTALGARSLGIGFDYGESSRGPAGRRP